MYNSCDMYPGQGVVVKDANIRREKDKCPKIFKKIKLY